MLPWRAARTPVARATVTRLPTARIPPRRAGGGRSRRDPAPCRHEPTRLVPAPWRLRLLPAAVAAPAGGRGRGRRGGRPVVPGRPRGAGGVAAHRRSGLGRVRHAADPSRARVGPLGRL